MLSYIWPTLLYFLLAAGWGLFAGQYGLRAIYFFPYLALLMLLFLTALH